MGNVTLVCGDGIVQSHKIIVAIVSDFIKDMMTPIPSAEDVTILIPDFKTAHVYSVIDHYIYGGTSLHSLNEELLNVLKCSSPVHNRFEMPVKCFIEKTEVHSVEIKQENTDEQCYEEPFIDCNNADSDDSENDIKQIKEFSSEKAECSGSSPTFSRKNSKIFSKEEENLITVRILQNLKDGETLNRKLVEDIILQELEILKRDHPERSKPANLSSFIRAFLSRNNLNDHYQKKNTKNTLPSKFSSSEYQQKIQDLAKKFLLNNNEDFESDESLIEEKKKAIHEKRVKLRKAVEAIASGQCKTLSSAGTKFGVNKKTLKLRLESGKQLTGPGTALTVFSREEEKLITERILVKSDGGKNLTMEIISDVLNDELSIMSINHPEKKLPESAKSFKYHFARRNNLAKLIQDKVEAKRKDRRIYECEICYYKFTFKNSLVSHQKKSHPAFYRC